MIATAAKSNRKIAINPQKQWSHISIGNPSGAVQRATKTVPIMNQIMIRPHQEFLNDDEEVYKQPVEDVALDNNLSSCHYHVLIVPSLCPHCRIIAVLLLPQSPCRIVIITNVDCRIIAVPSLLSLSHHRVAISICPHSHSGCTVAATVAMLLCHHQSPSPSHEWACIEWV